MVAEVYHPVEGVFVGEVHVGYATASGCVGGDTIIAGHQDFVSVVRLCRYALWPFIRQTPPFIKIIL